MTAHLTKTHDAERGNTLILSIALSAIAIALVLTFATITQIQIERKRLLALTDMAALYAATEIDEERYYSDPSVGVPLSDESVRLGVDTYLERLPASQASRFHQLSVTAPTRALNGNTAQVTLTAYVRPGYIPWGVIPFDGFFIETTSSARAD